LNSLLTVFEMLMIAVIVVIAGVTFFRPRNQTLRSAFSESLAWGAGFFVSYSTLILAFEMVPTHQLLGGWMS
jgi:predicted small integral membrane protein